MPENRFRRPVQVAPSSTGSSASDDAHLLLHLNLQVQVDVEGEEEEEEPFPLGPRGFGQNFSSFPFLSFFSFFCIHTQ